MFDHLLESSHQGNDYTCNKRIVETTIIGFVEEICIIEIKISYLSGALIVHTFQVTLL